MLKEPDLKPDTLTERWLRGLGWEIDQCHRREGPKEHDLFGFADQYAFSDGMHLMIQSTSHSGGNMSSRRKKIIASDYAVKWKRSCAGNLIYLVAWRDKKARVMPKVEEIQWDAVAGRLVAVTIDDPVATLDVRDPECLARAR